MHPVVAMLGLMFVTWVAAIWASYQEEPEGGAWNMERRQHHRKAS